MDSAKSLIIEVGCAIFYNFFSKMIIADDIVCNIVTFEVYQQFDKKLKRFYFLAISERLLEQNTKPSFKNIYFLCELFE